MVYHDKVYIFIQLMYNRNNHLAKQSIFVRCLMSSVASTTPFPPRPKTPFTYIVFVYSDISVTNLTMLSIFGMHAQEGYLKV